MYGILLFFRHSHLLYKNVRLYLLYKTTCGELLKTKLNKLRVSRFGLKILVNITESDVNKT